MTEEKTPEEKDTITELTEKLAAAQKGLAEHAGRINSLGLLLATEQRKVSAFASLMTQLESMLAGQPTLISDPTLPPIFIGVVGAGIVANQDLEKLKATLSEIPGAKGPYLLRLQVF